MYLGCVPEPSDFQQTHIKDFLVMKGQRQFTLYHCKMMSFSFIEWILTIDGPINSRGGLFFFLSKRGFTTYDGEDENGKILGGNIMGKEPKNIFYRIGNTKEREHREWKNHKKF